MSKEKKVRIVMDVDESLKSEIEANAKRCGLSMTYYLVWCALHEAPPQALPPDAIEELKAARDSLTRDIAEVREQLKTANKLLDLLTRMEKEIDEELALERSNAPFLEPITADDVLRHINSEDYDPTQHQIQSGIHPSVRRRSEWER